MGEFMNLKKQSTKATQFILPLLWVKNESFIFNCYINMNPEQIIIVCDGGPSTEFKKQTEDKSNILSEYTLEEINGFKVYTYLLPISDVLDFYNFVEGRYSKFSKTHKEWILRYNNVNDIFKLSKILNPKPKDVTELLDTLYDKWEYRPNITEIYSIPELKDEIFNKKELIKYKRK